MIQKIRIFLFLLSLLITLRRNMCFDDYSIEAFQLMNETSTSPFCNITVKLKRTKNVYPKVFFEADLVDDLKKYDVMSEAILDYCSNKAEYRMFYSSVGNDQYHLMPYRIYRQPVCDIINTVYRHALMDDAKEYTNAPYSKDKKVNLCDLMPMGHYYFRNYSINPSLFPSSLDDGRYRLELILYKQKEPEIVNGLIVTQLFT